MDLPAPSCFLRHVLHVPPKESAGNGPSTFRVRRFATNAYLDHNVAVGRYVIMPDHIHLFVCGPHDFELGRWIVMLKQYLGKQIHASRSLPMWQRGFFDHVLRNDEGYGDKWNYVRENPVRAGFVNDPDEWRYSGEIVVIDRA